jgi:hypothetical protein
MLYYHHFKERSFGSDPRRKGSPEYIDDDLIDTGKKIEAVRFIVGRDVERELTRYNRLEGHLEVKKLERGSNGEAQATPEENRKSEEAERRVGDTQRQETARAVKGSEESRKR